MTSDLRLRVSYSLSCRHVDFRLHPSGAKRLMPRTAAEAASISLSVGGPDLSSAGSISYRTPSAMTALVEFGPSPFLAPTSGWRRFRPFAGPVVPLTFDRC